MIGGADAAVAQLDPIFKTLAPGFDVAAHTQDATSGTAPQMKDTCIVVPQARGTS